MRTDLLKSSWLNISLLALLALSCIAGLLYVMAPFRVGIGYDSYFYLSTAQNLAAGEGLRYSSGGELSPLVHYPPLYPLILSIPIWAGLHAINSATALAAGLYGVNVFLAGWITYRYTRLAPLSLLAASLIAISPPIVSRHLEAMSEPLFFCFQLLSLWLIAESVMKQSDSLFLLSSGAAALAYLARYSGVVLIPTALLVYLFARKTTLAWRLKIAGLYALLSFLPGLILFWRNSNLTGSGTNRTFFFHPIPEERLAQGFETLRNWILVDSSSPAQRYGVPLLMAAVILTWLVVRWRLSKGHAHQNKISPGLISAFMLTVLVFSALYLVFLITSLTFFDASTKLNDRILAPFFVSMALAWIVSTVAAPKPEQILISGLMLTLLFSYTPATLKIFKTMRTEGDGFTSRAWRASQLVAITRAFNGQGKLFSNEAFPLEFLTGKPVSWVPEAFDSVNGQLRPDVDQKLAEMRSQLEAAHSALIVFKGKSYRQELPHLEDLSAGLVKVFSNDEGWIYVHPTNNLGDMQP